MVVDRYLFIGLFAVNSFVELIEARLGAYSSAID
jgi:hypothetical protein